LGDLFSDRFLLLKTKNHLQVDKSLTTFISGDDIYPGTRLHVAAGKSWGTLLGKDDILQKIGFIEDSLASKNIL